MALATLTQESREMKRETSGVNAVGSRTPTWQSLSLVFEMYSLHYRC